MTEEMTIEQQNVIIARFESRLFFGKFPIDAYGPKTCNAYPVMKYHSSWDWLMPVVEKIESFGLRFEICENCADIMSKGVENDSFPWLQEFDHIFGRPSENKKEAVYTTVVEFIKWYTAYISSPELK